MTWQLIDPVEFRVLFLDTEPKFALAKRSKAYNYGQKCNNKSSVTSFFPPHIFSGIYLNIQLIKTRAIVISVAPGTLSVYEAV